MTGQPNQNENNRKYQNDWYHANKHRLRDGRRQRNRDDYRARKEFIKAQKIKAGACCLCGLNCTEENHVVFDWDHIDPATKEINLGNIRMHPFNFIANEIAKCRLICKNCHALETYKNDHWKIRRDDNGNSYNFGQHPEQQQLEL